MKSNSYFWFSYQTPKGTFFFKIWGKHVGFVAVNKAAGRIIKLSDETPFDIPMTITMRCLLSKLLELRVNSLQNNIRSVTTSCCCIPVSNNCLWSREDVVVYKLQSPGNRETIDVYV